MSERTRGAAAALTNTKLFPQDGPSDGRRSHSTVPLMAPCV